MREKKEEETLWMKTDRFANYQWAFYFETDESSTSEHYIWASEW